MVKTHWPPLKKVQDDSHNHSLNGSFNNSFNHNSASGFPSPRKFGSFTKGNSYTSTAKTRGSVSQDTDFEHAPRFALFDTVAEIKYLPEEDNVAASVYADRVTIKEEPKAARKARTSGYDFDTLLKDVDVESYPRWRK